MLPIDVLKLICSYSEEVSTAIHPDLWWNLSILGNPHAEDLIDEYLSKKITVTLDEMKRLAKNPKVKYLSYLDVKRYPALIEILCKHPSLEAMELVRDSDVKNWSHLSANPFAISLLRENPDKIDYTFLSNNPGAYHLLKELVTTGTLGHFPFLRVLSGIHAERLYREIPDVFPDRVVYYSPVLLDVRESKFGISSLTSKEICSHPEWLGRILGMEQSLWEVEGLVRNPNPEIEHLLVALIENREMTENEVEHLSECRYPLVLEMIVARYYNQVDRDALSRNPMAIDLLLRDLSLVRWDSLACNPSERVIEAVLLYRYSFLASERYNSNMYLRKEILVEDKERYNKKMKEKVKIFSQY